MEEIHNFKKERDLDRIFNVLLPLCAIQIIAGPLAVVIGSNMPNNSFGYIVCSFLLAFLYSASVLSSIFFLIRKKKISILIISFLIIYHLILRHFGLTYPL